MAANIRSPATFNEPPVDVDGFTEFPNVAVDVADNAPTIARFPDPDSDIASVLPPYHLKSFVVLVGTLHQNTPASIPNA